MEGTLPLVERLKRAMKRRHPWLVMTMLAMGAALHYSAQIRSIPETPFALTRHAMERVLFMLPVVYAAFTLGMLGGLVTLSVAVLIMLPRVLYISPSPADALVEAIAVVLVGVLISWMVETQERERRQRLKALADLDRSEAMLRHYLRQIIRAQEDERGRLARELHDDTAQALVILSHRLDGLDAYREQLPEPVMQRLEELLELADDILRGVRRFSRDLRPPVLDDLGLVPALESLTADLQREGIRTEFDVLGHKRSLSPEVELTLFRITQEALRNVQKHADASGVWVRVEFEDAGVSITVRDNGKGFRMPEEIGDLAEAGRLGLLGIQERAQLIGGSLTIQSELGEGTTIAVDVPA
jgi:two-component system sensor histidine kinase DegS